jgi:hypothetical protein
VRRHHLVDAAQRRLGVGRQRAAALQQRGLALWRGDVDGDAFHLLACGVEVLQSLAQGGDGFGGQLRRVGRLLGHGDATLLQRCHHLLAGAPAQVEEQERVVVELLTAPAGRQAPASAVRR